MQLVDVSTFAPGEDETEMFRQINLTVRADREWLYRHLMWALNNKHSVECNPVEATNGQV